MFDRKISWVRGESARTIMGVSGEPCSFFDCGPYTAAAGSSIPSEVRTAIRAAMSEAMQMMRSPDWQRLMDEAYARMPASGGEVDISEAVCFLRVGSSRASPAWFDCRDRVVKFQAVDDPFLVRIAMMPRPEEGSRPQYASAMDRILGFYSIG